MSSVDTMQEDKMLLAEVRTKRRAAKVVDIKKVHFTLDLWESQCTQTGSSLDEVLLLVPESYTILRREQTLLDIAEVHQPALTLCLHGPM